MAERQIGIRIELNGWRGVIQNIEQFEKLIKEAKEDLRQLDIGGATFAELTRQIQNAETQLIQLQESQRGYSPEKQLEGYGKLAGGITSSFAAATAAVQLFGGESTAVAEAAVQAQNIMTVALSARGIAEVGTGLKIVATTIAQKAKNAADTASIAITKKLYTLIAANPYGAILAVLGLLVTAMIAFSGATEEQVKQQKLLNDAFAEAEKSIIAQKNQIKSLTNVVLDNNAATDVRKQAYKELQKLVPELTYLTYEEALALGDLEKKTKAATDALYDKALADIFAKKAAEEAAKQIDIENASIEDLTTFTQRFVNGILAGMGPLRTRNQLILNGTDAQKEQNKQLEESQRREAIYNERAEFYNRKRIEREAAVNQLLEDEKQRLDRIAKAEENRKLGVEKLTEALKRQVEVYKALIRDLDTLAGQTFDVSSEIITKSEDIISQQEELLQKRRELFKTDFEVLKQNITETFLLLVPDEEQRRYLVDGFFQIFTELDKQIYTTSETITGNIDQLIDAFFGVNETVELAGKTFTKLQFKELIPAESQEELVKYFRTFNDLIIRLEAFQKDETQLVKLNDTLDITEILLNLQSELGILLQEQTDFGTSDLEVRTKLVESITKQFDLQKQFLPLYDAQGNLIKDEIGERQAVNDAVNDFIDLIIKAIYNQTVFKEGVIATNKEVEKLGKTIEDNYTKQIEQLIKKGLPALQGEFLNALQTGTKETENFLNVILSLYDELDAIFSDEQLLSIFDAFNTYITESTDLTAEQLQELLDIINKFRGSFEERLQGSYTKFNEITKLIQGDLDDINLDNFVGELAKAFEIFSDKVGQIASLFRENVSVNLEILQVQSEKALAQVVGDTAEANQKRLELTQQYETRKAEIEKKARLRSLQFQLTQSIADNAAATLRTFADYGFTPLGIALASIGAGLGAVQIGIIGKQIALVKSLRRGGKLASGGMLSGPSHENGGITYGQLGIQLEGNEAVITRGATLDYQSLLSQINQSAGGRPLVNNPMDSRLIEVLAKERQTPIRAYVVEQDITKAQNINRKLDQLATF